MNTILANFFNDFKERFESLFDSLEMPDPENHDAFRLWSMKLLGKDRSLSIDYLEEQIKTIISRSSTSILAMFLAMIDRLIHEAKADRKTLNPNLCRLLQSCPEKRGTGGDDGDTKIRISAQEKRLIHDYNNRSGHRG